MDKHKASDSKGHGDSATSADHNEERRFRDRDPLDRMFHMSNFGLDEADANAYTEYFFDLYGVERRPRRQFGLIFSTMSSTAASPVDRGIDPDSATAFDTDRGKAASSKSTLAGLLRSMRSRGSGGSIGQSIHPRQQERSQG